MPFLLNRITHQGQAQGTARHHSRCPHAAGAVRLAEVATRRAAAGESSTLSSIRFRAHCALLVQILQDAEKELPDVAALKVPSRVWKLPMAFHDKWNREAIERYMSAFRSTAPYLPDNVEFVAANNGLAGPDAVRDIVFKASYMCLGLGDVYLGAPCAVPVDPRHRLSVPKYNPARTYTPEGAVGIGGSFMCIYPMESPGGYQLIGRTLPIWNQAANLPNFKNPWLLDMFDQVQFYQVGEKDLESLRADFAKVSIVGAIVPSRVRCSRACKTRGRSRRRWRRPASMWLRTIASWTQ